jgi:hypothetical protein
MEDEKVVMMVYKGKVSREEEAWVRVPHRGCQQRQPQK